MLGAAAVWREHIVRLASYVHQRSCKINLTEVLGSLSVAKGGPVGRSSRGGEKFRREAAFLLRGRRLSHHTVIANGLVVMALRERERRGNGGNGLRALADALNGEVAVVHKAAKNALVHVDVFSTLSRLISKVRRLMKPVLWTTRMLATSVSVGQRWNRAVAVQYKAASPATAANAKANQHQRIGSD